MNKVELFHEHTTNLAVNLKALADEDVKLRRQIDYVGNSLELYKLTGHAEDLEKATAMLELLQAKLLVNTDAQDNLNVIPFAEGALEELTKRRNALEDELHGQLNIVKTAREIFITELQVLGEIRKAGESLHWESKPVCLQLRMNPIEELHVGGRYEMAVELDEVNKLIG